MLRFLLARIAYFSRLKATGLSMVGRNCEIYIRKGGKITLGKKVILNDQVMLFSKGKLQIGHSFGINSFSRIVAHQDIKIGNHVTIGRNVAILDHDHGYQMSNGQLKLRGYHTAPVRIGDNVWIGDKVTILKGVTIGNNVVIGAHTLVNKNVQDNCIIAGNPHKVIKELK